LWHYQFGSKYDTPFWEYAKSLPFYPDEKFKKLIKVPFTKKELEKVMNGEENFEIEKYLYGQWPTPSIKNWKEGVE
jgi:hypothetical protein